MSQKKYELTVSQIIIFILLAVSIIAVSSMAIQIDRSTLIFGISEKKIDVIYPDNTKFGLRQLQVQVNFTYEKLRSDTPNFFMEYFFTYPQEINNTTLFTAGIKFLFERARVTSLLVKIVGDYQGYDYYLSPIYYDNLNTPLQDAFLFIYGLPDLNSP